MINILVYDVSKGFSVATLIVQMSWNMLDQAQEVWKSLPSTWMTLAICMDWVRLLVFVCMFVCA